MWTRRETVAVAITALATGWTHARAQTQAPSVNSTLLPTGKLRAALIASNPVLVTRRADGTFGGVSVVVARALAAHLGVPVDLKPYDNPARYNESLATDDWDIGLAARDPSRAEHASPPPLVGEHTAEVLAELDYSETEIDALAADGVVRLG